jgi:four helix bundle protein
MKNEKGTTKRDLKHRMYVWTLKLIQIIDDLPQTNSNNVIARQVLRSGTSVCANYVEGQAASSKKDFINYLHIALKSANESKYWLAVLRDLKRIEKEKLTYVVDELEQISKMLGASIIKLKNIK